MNKFKRIIKDKKILWLIETIVNINPIGWFSNFYLNDLDIQIKKHIKYYIRYVDDIIIFWSNKKELHKVLELIKRKLNEDSLELKDNYQLFNTKVRDINFLDFRFFKNKTIIRKRIMYNIKRKLKKKLTVKNTQPLVSYFEWNKHSNSYNFYIKNFN